MTYGVDCTCWDSDREKFCGAPAVYVRLQAGDAQLVDMVCVQHARVGDTLIPPNARKAPRSVFWRGYRFVTSLTS